MKLLSELQSIISEMHFDEPLTGYHIVYRNSGNPVIATPSFETKEAAQKYLMTKMFHNHQDFKVVHTSKVGIVEAIDFKKEMAAQMKIIHDKNSTPANKAFAEKMLRRALEASKMKDKDAAYRHYIGAELKD